MEGERGRDESKGKAPKRARSSDSAKTAASSSSSSRNKGAKGSKASNGTTTKQPRTMDPAAEKYTRGPLDLNAKPNQAHKGLRKTLVEGREQMRDAAERTAATEVLLPGQTGSIELAPGHRTFKLSQADIAQAVDLNTQRHAFDLSLAAFGPYGATYSRNGRFLLMAGEKGHVATFDCLRTCVGAELQLQETVHDAQYLHNESLFAVAQNKYTYIYDNKGVEIHCLKKHERPYRLSFLPYHFLLTSLGHSGWIKWHDVSIGEYVAGYQTGHGPARVLKHNPANAVSHVGHSNGVVTLWSPAAGKALVSMFCHKSPLTDLAVDRQGRYMCTAGLDGLMKVWDLRKYTCLHSYRLDHPAASLDVSDTGLVAMGLGRSVQVLQHAFTTPSDATYLRHSIKPPASAALGSGSSVTAAVRALASSVSVRSVKFRPLEDVLCCGHSGGVSSLIVPGAGEANFDSFENNPFVNRKQRREAEVQGLLQKLSSDMIGLDAGFVGQVDKDQATLRVEHQEIFYAANQAASGDKKEKNRKRGRNKISAKLRRKQKNVVDAQTVKLKEKQRAERGGGAGKEVADGNGKDGGAAAARDLGALGRFAKADKK